MIHDAGRPQHALEPETRAGLPTTMEDQPELPCAPPPATAPSGNILAVASPAVPEALDTFDKAGGGAGGFLKFWAGWFFLLILVCYLTF